MIDTRQKVKHIVTYKDFGCTEGTDDETRKEILVEDNRAVALLALPAPGDPNSELFRGKGSRGEKGKNDDSETIPLF